MEHGTIQILVTWEKHPETGQLQMHSEFNITVPQLGEVRYFQH